MSKLLPILLTLRLIAHEPGESPTPPPTEHVHEEQALEQPQNPAVEEQIEEHTEQVVEQQQEEFGSGSTPNLPAPASTLKRNLTMLIFSLVSLVCGIAAVGHNPGRGA